MDGDSETNRTESTQYFALKKNQYTLLSNWLQSIKNLAFILESTHVWERKGAIGT